MAGKYISIACNEWVWVFIYQTHIMADNIARLARPPNVDSVSQGESFAIILRRITIHSDFTVRSIDTVLNKTGYCVRLVPVPPF